MELLVESTTIYKFVAEQAKLIGVSMDNIDVRIRDDDAFKDNMNLVPNYKTGRNTIVIGANYFSNVASVAGEDIVISALRGGIKHELSHSERSPILVGSIVSSVGAYKLRRLEECRADFIADDDAVNFLRVTSYLRPKVYFETGKNSAYPSTRDRLKAAALRKFTEQESGEKVGLSDVNIAHDCNFSISDIQKLDSITPEVVDRAKKLTDEFMNRLDKEIANIQTVVTTSGNAQNLITPVSGNKGQSQPTQR